MLTGFKRRQASGRGEKGSSESIFLEDSSSFLISNPIERRLHRIQSKILPCDPYPQTHHGLLTRKSGGCGRQERPADPERVYTLRICQGKDVWSLFTNQMWASRRDSCPGGIRSPAKGGWLLGRRGIFTWTSTLPREGCFTCFFHRSGKRCMILLRLGISEESRKCIMREEVSFASYQSQKSQSHPG